MVRTGIVHTVRAVVRVPVVLREVLVVGVWCLMLLRRAFMVAVAQVAALITAQLLALARREGRASW
jgi:hypothetical protein